eukprot:TRINITY_DN122513_c0_g1_i1.p1 TRINITY_DN122513_c0_g1~~TRINITY_DN122513_c0_g1_i1.p1  ORF type:complete len:299 (+),score=44.09 TRINITY_DN122513_c0_g1_i1:124-1020(+)
MSILARLLYIHIILVRCVGARSLRQAEHRHGLEAAVASTTERNASTTVVRGKIISDEEPTVLNLTDDDLPQHDAVTTLHGVGGPFKENPKNGTPWFRMKRTSNQGQASHSHFEGLVASGNFVEDMSRAHNAVRQRVGLPELHWNGKLASLATNYVESLVDGGCYIRHSSTGYRWSEAGFSYVGENLYKVINMEPSGVDVVDAWYAEIDDYTYGPVGSGCVKERCAGRTSPPCAMGHFTQVMWQSSTDFGCARRQCPGESHKTFIVVCHYGEGGNIVGEVPFATAYASQLGVGTASCAR